MSLWLTVFILFVVLWLIEGYLKNISDNLSYLIDLLEKNYKLDDDEQVDQTNEQDNQIRSRRDLYKQWKILQGLSYSIINMYAVVNQYGRFYFGLIKRLNRALNFWDNIFGFWPFTSYQKKQSIKKTGGGYQLTRLSPILNSARLFIDFQKIF